MDFAGFSREGFSEAMEQTKALFKITLDNLWGGIGLSDNTVKAYLWDIFPENVNISHEYSNTFLLMTLQLGIFGILLFMFILLLVIGSYTVWGRSRKANKKLTLVGVSGISMLAAFIFLGFLEFVFSDTGVSLVFWMMGGLVYASSKVIKDEACGIEERDLAVFHVNKKKAEVIADAELGEGEV